MRNPPTTPPRSTLSLALSPCRERGSGLFVLCAVSVFVLTGALGCDGAPEPTATPEPTPTSTPEESGAEFEACQETCVAKGGSDANCRTFCAGGTVGPPAEEGAGGKSEEEGKDGKGEEEDAGDKGEGDEAKDVKAPVADSEGCYEACIAKGGGESTCRGVCEGGKVGVDGEKDGTEWAKKPASDTSAFLTFEHDGVSRHYLYHAPSDLPANAPLVFFLHGHGG